jgi:glycosyltransferase involved in cell wall biosynthesis
VTYHSDILRFNYIKWVPYILQFLVSRYINFYHFSSRNFKKICDLRKVKNYFIESFTIKKLTINKENITIKLIKNLPKKYVLFLGRDRHYKGFDKLEKIILLNLNINFVCITDYAFNFKSKNLKIFNNVNEDEKTYLIKNSFLLINTSDSTAESFGFSILESLSLGIPAIVFKLNSGTNFLIKNNFNGYIIDNFNLDLFSQRINDLYNNSKLI